MSSAIIRRAENGVEMFTDGAVVDATDNYVLIGRQSIAYAFPHVPCIMTALGSIHVLFSLLCVSSSSWTSFDCVVDRIGRDVRDAHQYAFDHRIDGAREVNSQVYFGGWSESRERWETYGVLICHHDVGSTPKVYGLPSLFCHPYPHSDADREFVGIPSKDELIDIGQFEIDIDRLLAWQRITGEPLADGTMMYGVGGFVQHTAMTKEGISTRIIHRWDDPIGEPINPFPIS
jgi:hypothetical protein